MLLQWRKIRRNFSGRHRRERPARNRHDNRKALDRDRVMGPHGISYVNAAGKSLLQILGMNGLCAPTSYFRKKGYTTWIHPARKSHYQLYCFFVKQRDLKRVRDARCLNHGVDSDHSAILLKLEMAHSFSGPHVLRVLHVSIEVCFKTLV